MERPARILVADDDERIRDATRAVLVDAGYEVALARDGDELVRAYRAEPTDLILCDLFMPGKDGLEAIRELHRQFSAAKIIAMSGGAYDGALDLLRTARHMGACEVLTKPFTRTVLLELVERLTAVD